MESRLRKSSIYGLLFGLAISILFVNYKDVTQIGDGVYQTTYKPVIEYIVSILRFGIIGMFLGLFIGWKSFNREQNSQQKTKQEKTYYLLFFLIVFLVSSILMLVY